MTQPQRLQRSATIRLLGTFMSLGLVVACSDDDSIPELPAMDSGLDSTVATDVSDSESTTRITDPRSTESEPTDSIDTSAATTTSVGVTSTSAPSTDETRETEATSVDTSGDAGSIDTAANTGTDTELDVTLIPDSGLDASTDPTPQQDASFDASPDEVDASPDGTTTEVTSSADSGLDAGESDVSSNADAGAPIVLTAQDFAASTGSLLPDEIPDALLHATLDGAIDALVLAQTNGAGIVIGETFWWSKPSQLVPAAIDVFGGQTTNWNLYVLADDVPVMTDGTMNPLPSGTHHLDIYASWVTFSETAYFRLFALDNLGNIIDTQDFVY